MLRTISTAAILAVTPSLVRAQDFTTAATNDSGDTAWILTATALVLLMTLPGLGLFYGGLVRAKNFLSVLVQVAAVAGIASVLWVMVGYTLAFGNTAGGWIGDGSRWMMIDLGNVSPIATTLPESTFAMFQLTFAAITPALMVGAWVDRARFGWVVAFTAIWGLLVYAPVAHWIWGGGWLGELGVLDFAGGIVVHTTAGVSALVVALLLGKRQGFPGSALLPHAPGMTMLGAMLLWVGWFGFNGGSAVTATDDASMAIINTHTAAATAALAWALIEKIAFGKATTIGFATGAIAGLATVTPAAGFISPGAAILFGVLASLVCYYAIQLVKMKLGIDDSLDVFAVHGVGGMLGTLLLGAFLSADLGGVGYADGVTMTGMIGTQALGIGVVAIFSAIVTAVIAIGVSLFIPMRVSEDEETQGLDVTSHGERSWQFD
ncbi:ammonium transporter [Aurantiacibacter poecillastricola]|uniref:ammonium transporter n=1 Tax=Aurantiacibacter poecillastricola TaxID=3064385 RepID=UPI00273E8AC4|nr:ammonium transporter [Aurantiacibacter sp. 219JJ12-13]MDP5262138.1 ammonium transporter [Aurantiacibacter sp. 219JJ12-13]